MTNQEGRLVTYQEGKQGGKQWHLVPKQSHPVAKQCHPIGKQENRVGHLVELAGLSVCILGVVIGDDNQFLYALLCHFMDVLLCMNFIKKNSTH